MSGIPDFWGGVIGIISILVMLVLWKYADLLGDGNVERLEREEKEDEMAA